LILISHGHFDAAISAPDFIKAATKSNCKIVCNKEIADYYIKWRNVAPEKILKMNKGCPNKQEGFDITMVSADHSSSCGFVGN